MKSSTSIWKTQWRVVGESLERRKTREKICDYIIMSKDERKKWRNVDKLEKLWSKENRDI